MTENDVSEALKTIRTLYKQEFSAAIAVCDKVRDHSAMLNFDMQRFDRLRGRLTSLYLATLATDDFQDLGMINDHFKFTRDHINEEVKLFEDVIEERTAALDITDFKLG